MRSFPVLGAAVLAMAFALAGCAGQSQSIYGPGPGGSYKIGKPYRVGGVWYYPAEDPGYNRVGLASWYGRDFQGRKTANGETFDRHRMTAAHPTLPMPVLVRVTNLDNGRSALVRVNDRGPFTQGRIIDVSQAVAKALGFEKQGVTRVRVQYAGRADGVAQKPAAGEKVAGEHTNARIVLD